MRNHIASELLKAAKDIVAARKLKKGDRVYHNDSSPKEVGTIVKIDGGAHGDAKVEWDDGEVISHQVRDLRKAAKELTADTKSVNAKFVEADSALVELGREFYRNRKTVDRKAYKKIDDLIVRAIEANEAARSTWVDASRENDVPQLRGAKELTALDPYSNLSQADITKLFSKTNSPAAVLEELAKFLKGGKFNAISKVISTTSTKVSGLEKKLDDKSS